MASLVDIDDSILDFDSRSGGTSHHPPPRAGGHKKLLESLDSNSITYLVVCLLSIVLCSCCFSRSWQDQRTRPDLQASS